MTDISQSGIFKIVLNLPDKKRVLFAATENNTWVEFANFLQDLKSNNSLCLKLSQTIKTYGRDSFHFRLFDAGWKFLNTYYKNLKLHKYINEFKYQFPFPKTKFLGQVRPL